MLKRIVRGAFSVVVTLLLATLVTIASTASADAARDETAKCGGNGQYACWFSKAKKHKSVACRRGQFYDLLTNACWSCGNGWNRSIFPIKGSQACHKPPRLEHKKATYIRKGAACDAGKLEFFDLPTWSCWSCGKGYNRTLLPIKGRNACVQGIGGKYKKAKVSHYRKCAAGQFVDIRNGGECWSCPAGYNRHITPITGKDACHPAIQVSMRTSKATLA